MRLGMRWLSCLNKTIASSLVMFGVCMDILFVIKAKISCAHYMVVYVPSFSLPPPPQKEKEKKTMLIVESKMVYHIFQHVVQSFLNTCVFYVGLFSHKKSCAIQVYVHGYGK